MTEFTSTEQLYTLLKYLWVTEIVMTLILAFIKMSVLFWSWSIFSAASEFRLPVLIDGGLVLAWGTISTFLVAFQCDPIYATWDLVAATTAKCMPFGELVLGYEILNIILDVAILILPARMVMRLNMAKGKKIMTIAVFSLVTLCVTIPSFATTGRQTLTPVILASVLYVYYALFTCTIPQTHSVVRGLLFILSLVTWAFYLLKRFH
jgi:hypothetical protein